MAYYSRIVVLALLLPVLSLFVCAGTTSHASSPNSSLTVQSYFKGTPQEVTVYRITGREKNGPTLLIFSGIHGDERSCPAVAQRYADVRLKRGNLIIVPRLNTAALRMKKRAGPGGDMNRLFDLPENSGNPDFRVVNLARTLIKDADYVLNLHQGSGFYSPTWVDKKRNPSKWGQSNVIDTPIFDLPNGEKLELGKFAQNVVQRSNTKIKDKRYVFHVNNTDTGNENSFHREQRKSLTYYAVTQQHKVALGLEVTKNCSLPEAVSFFTIAINSIIEETGIIPEHLPSEQIASIKKEITPVHTARNNRKQKRN